MSDVKREPGSPQIVLGDRSHRNLAHSVLLEEAVAPRHVRLTIGLLTASLAGFILWSLLAPLDEVAVAPGLIVPSGAVQIVQHQDGGTIAQIAVADGAPVAKGELLIALDPVETQAELRASEARHWALVAKIARLRAQAEENWDSPAFDEVPQAHAELVRDQRAILDSHRRAIENQEKVIRAQIAQYQAELGRVEEQVSAGQREVGILREVAGIRSELEKNKLATKVQSLETQRTLVVQEGDLQRHRAQRKATLAAVAEARARLATLRSDRRQSANDEIGAASAELAQLTELLIKLRKRLTRMEIHAPVRGIVQDLKYRTIGGVIPPGAVVMNVVPVEDVMQAEVRISTSDVGHVKAGQFARVKVLTYDFLRYGTVDGEVTTVSASSFVDEKGNPYFKAIVRLSRSHLGAKPDELPVLPGMTVVGDIVTDRKTVFQYLIRPIAVAFRQGLRER